MTQQPEQEAQPTTNSKPEAAKAPAETAPAKDEEPMPERTLVSAQAWDVWAPPPNSSLKGYLIPTAINRYRRRRRISVEVHRVHQFPSSVDETRKKTEPKKEEAPSRGIVKRLSVATLGDTDQNQGGRISYEEAIVRVLVPANAEEDRASRKRGKAALKSRRKSEKQASALGHTNGPSENISVGGHDEYEEVSLLDGESLEQQTTVVGADLDDQESSDKKWKPKYRLPLDAVTVNLVLSNVASVTTNYKGVKQSRTLLFDNDQDAKGFSQAIKVQTSLQKSRSDEKLKAALGGLHINLDKEISLLIEIVSGWDLPAGDLTSSDPFVVASINGKEVHRTKYISKTLDPIWTIKTDSLFLLDNITVRDFFMSEGVMFHVFDYDQFGANESLGAMTVPPKKLYDGKSERMEFKLQKGPKQKEDYDTGCLAIRCRQATEYDKKFMAQYKEGEKKEQHKGLLMSAVAKADSKAGGRGSVHSMITKYKRTERHGPDAGFTKYKVRPSPDPKRKEDTVWLSKEQIEKECLEESNHWLDIGSGNLGRIFVEILACDDLPNLDTGIGGNKTDAFVSVIFEDCLMQTDIIDDCLSPRWLPWSKRAFIFHMMHSSSPLFLGVFDHDGGVNDHDLIGRVSVDVSNLRPDTVYVLKYNIYTTATMSTRKSKGTVTIRLRMEIDDPRRLLLSNLEPPPQIYVNVKNKRDFRVARYTFSGKYDMERYNMKVINSYIEELVAYKLISHYLEDAMISLFLWRGQFKLSMMGKTILLPIHSLSAFLVGVMLVERPTLIPSFFFASISWMLLAVMAWRRRSPNLWTRCKSFSELLQMLVLGKSMAPPDSIEPYENAKEAQEFLDEFQNRVKKAEEEAKREAEEALKAQEERERELAEIGEIDIDISSKSGGISIDPFKAILFPIQQYLAILCRAVRFGKNIILWEECYLAFWLTTGCLILSSVCLLVPWAFLLRWSSRTVVWTFFGPWMKLVDIFYYSKLKPLTEEEEAQKIEEARKREREATAAAVMEARMMKEDASKLKDIKKYMFGKFITKVPVLKQERYRDTPLPESSAVPYQPEPLKLADLAMREAGYNRTRLTGQHLVGTMIPRVETKSFTDAPVGKATAHPNLLDKESPGANLPGTDTTAAAYLKIGSLLATTGVITWFGVPLITSLIESAWKTVAFYVTK